MGNFPLFCFVFSFQIVLCNCALGWELLLHQCFWLLHCTRKCENKSDSQETSEIPKTKPLEKDLENSLTPRSCFRLWATFPVPFSCVPFTGDWNSSVPGSKIWKPKKEFGRRQCRRIPVYIFSFEEWEKRPVESDVVKEKE